MAACHAETTISLEMDSELDESEILQCTPPSIVIQFYVLLLLMVPPNRPSKCSFLMFSKAKSIFGHIISGTVEIIVFGILESYRIFVAENENLSIKELYTRFPS